MSSNQIVLITGANTGLGFETVRSLCQSNKAYAILLGGRDLKKAEAAVQKAQEEFPETPSMLIPIQVDIEDDDSISQAFENVDAQYGRLDILINNAGAAFDGQFNDGQMTMRELWDKSWRVNTTSTQVLTHTFVPLLLKSSGPRLLFITSGTANLTESDNAAFPFNISPGKGWPKANALAFSAYRSSKTGMNMMMREWTRILGNDGVKVFCISPGFLATGLGGDRERKKKMGAQDPSLGADFIRKVVEGGHDQSVGKVLCRSGIQPW